MSATRRQFRKASKYLDKILGYGKCPCWKCKVLRKLARHTRRKEWASIRDYLDRSVVYSTR